LKRASVHVLAATAVASFVLLWVSAMPAFAFASPNPHPNPDNNGNHYGWYKHPPTPPPLPTPKPTTQPTPQTPPGTTAPGTTQGNQDPPTTQSTGSDAAPAAIVLPGESKIVVVDVKADDLALWIIYLLLAALALLWIGLVAATTVRSMTGRPAPKQA
jgi:hypothetical protein